ncbi:MAG: helix-turn-helix domain containing protein, partial [Methanophagales archaeon]|nr:helix-turn-helix domain containing protein [Methanophagales archaeon]
MKKFEEAYYRGYEELKNILRDVEEGDIFSSAIGIKNFLEGDYFGWYLDVWDEQIGEAVSTLAKTLSEYEPATLEHEPDEAKDLLKYNVPKQKIRSYVLRWIDRFNSEGLEGLNPRPKS